MDVLTLSGVRIEGVVACLPENILDNRVACADLFGEGVETLVKATGIEHRAVASPGTTSLDLGIAAARELFERTSTDPADVGAVICVTFTPEYLMPSDAPAAQAALGIPTHSLGFDLSLACSGYGYGLYLAGSLAKALNKKVLLLDGDVQSAYVSPADKATVPVMADIGTATLVAPGSGAEWRFAFYTDGSRREALFIPAGGSRRPTRPDDLEPVAYDDGSLRRATDIYMDGFEIFRFVAQDASKFIAQFISETEAGLPQLDGFVPHQANMYMINQLARKLKIDSAQVWRSGQEYGNPASGSVPLTIARCASDQLAPDRENSILLAGFGGGLSISVARIGLDPAACYAVCQYGKDDSDG